MLTCKYQEKKKPIDFEVTTSKVKLRVADNILKFDGHIWLLDASSSFLLSIGIKLGYMLTH